MHCIATRHSFHSSQKTQLSVSAFSSVKSQSRLVSSRLVSSRLVRPVASAQTKPTLYSLTHTAYTRPYRTVTRPDRTVPFSSVPPFSLATLLFSQPTAAVSSFAHSFTRRLLMVKVCFTSFDPLRSLGSILSRSGTILNETTHDTQYLANIVNANKYKSTFVKSVALNHSNSSLINAKSSYATFCTASKPLITSFISTNHKNVTFNRFYTARSAEPKVELTRIVASVKAAAISTAAATATQQQKHESEVADVIASANKVKHALDALADKAVATAVKEDGLLSKDYSAMLDEAAAALTGASPQLPLSKEQLHVPAFATNTLALQSVYRATMRAAATADDLTGGLHRDRAFFVHDLARPERQYERWQRELPRLQPFYAVKCNPDARLLQTLRNKGASFDCASGEEIRAALATGASVDEIIFANPIKSISDLRYAASVGVRMMTFDNDAELLKIKAHAPEAQLVIRLLPDDSGSVMRFGSKFGADEADAPALLQLANQLGLSVIGTSFHIGSGCFDPTKYESAIAMCRRIHDVAHFDLGLPRMTLLDIGGGFSGATIDESIVEAQTKKIPPFEQFAGVINAALEAHFNTRDMGHVKCIAEPGRYFATSLSTLFTLIQGKRNVRKVAKAGEDVSSEPNKILLYVNDGVYGSFNNLMFDHAKVEPLTIAQLFADQKVAEPKAMSKIAAASAHESVARSMFHRLASVSTSASLSSQPRQPIASNQFAHSRAMRHSHAATSSSSLVTIFGNTCDSIDKLCQDYPMQGELTVGDWLMFKSMGAYTSAANSAGSGSGSGFNGFFGPSNIFVRSRADL